MDSGISTILALISVMAVLAAVPSASVLAVTAKSASSGFWQGALTAVGIILGDVIFILLAVFGLALLVDAMGAAFILVKYAGASTCCGLAPVFGVPGNSSLKAKTATAGHRCLVFSRDCSSRSAIKRPFCSI